MNCIVSNYIQQSRFKMPGRNYNFLGKGNVMGETGSLAVPSFHTPALVPSDQLLMLLFHAVLRCSADPFPKITGLDGSFAWVSKSTPALSCLSCPFFHISFLCPHRHCKIAPTPHEPHEQWPMTYSAMERNEGK